MPLCIIESLITVYISGSEVRICQLEVKLKLKQVGLEVGLKNEWPNGSVTACTVSSLWA